MVKITEQLHQMGQSLWLDNITPRAAGQRHAAALHRRAVGHRVDFQSEHFQPGHQELELL